MAKDVFICHASKDADVANALVQQLEAKGASCWIAPRDVEAGAVWAASIEEAIEGSSVLLMLVSDEANASKHVLREVERGVSNGCRLAAVRLEDVQLSSAFEYFLGAVHWIDMLDHETPAAHERVARQIVQAMRSRKIEAAPARRTRGAAGDRASWTWRRGLLVGGSAALVLAAVLWAVLSGKDAADRPPGIDMAITLKETKNAAPLYEEGMPAAPADWKPRYRQTGDGAIPRIVAIVPARVRQTAGKLNATQLPGRDPWPLPVLRLAVDNRTTEDLMITTGRLTVKQVVRSGVPLFQVIANAGNVLQIRNILGTQVANARLVLAGAAAEGCVDPVLAASGTFAGTAHGAWRLNLQAYAPAAGSENRCLAGTLQWSDESGATQQLRLRQRVLVYDPDSARGGYLPVNVALTRGLVQVPSSEAVIPRKASTSDDFFVGQTVLANHAFGWDVKLRALERGVYDLDIELLGVGGRSLVKASVQVEIFKLPQLANLTHDWWSERQDPSVPRTDGN